MLTADRKIMMYHGTRQVELAVGRMCILHLEILVVEGKLLGFDLLQEFDAVKKLKGIHLNELGEVISFQRTYPDVP